MQINIIQNYSFCDYSFCSDFTTREKVQHLIKRTFPLYDRSCTNASLDSMEIFKQQKMTILDAKSRTSYKELTDSKPVFILDNGQQGPSRANTPEQRADIMSDYDSMRESYSLKDYTMERNRKAIPNLLGKTTCILLYHSINMILIAGVVAGTVKNYSKRFYHLCHFKAYYKLYLYLI